MSHSLFCPITHQPLGPDALRAPCAHVFSPSAIATATAENPTIVCPICAKHFAADECARIISPQSHQHHPTHLLTSDPSCFIVPRMPTTEPIRLAATLASNPAFRDTHTLSLAFAPDCPSPAAIRPRIAITVLIDTSASMKNEHRFTATKTALKTIAALLGHHDSLTLIPFGARHTTAIFEPMDPTNRAAAAAFITALVAEGPSNLAPVLPHAITLARRAHHVFTHIIVISDTPVPQPPTIHHTDPFAIHTVGYPSPDLATAGTGHYVHSFSAAPAAVQTLIASIFTTAVPIITVATVRSQGLLASQIHPTTIPARKGAPIAYIDANTGAPCPIHPDAPLPSSDHTPPAYLFRAQLASALARDSINIKDLHDIARRLPDPAEAAAIATDIDTIKSAKLPRQLVDALAHSIHDARPYDHTLFASSALYLANCPTLAERLSTTTALWDLIHANLHYNV